MPETSLAPELPDSDRWGQHAGGPLPFDAFRLEFLELYQPPLRAKATLQGMRHALGVVAEVLGPDATTADLTPAFIARLIASRDGANDNTTRSLLMKVKAICSYSHSQGYTRTNAFAFRKTWLRPAAHAPKKHHSRAEVRRVLDLLAREVESSSGWDRWRARRLKAMVHTFAFTGMRRDEGLCLQVQDLDLDNRMIAIVERAGKRFKTERSAQPIPMAEPLAEALAEWLPYRLDRPEAGFKAPPEDCPWLFPNVTRSNRWKDGGPGVRAIDQIKAAGERAGVRGFTFLSLRHSWATAAEHWGLPDVMIQRILRHTTTNTQKHYRHSDYDNLRAAVRGIDFDAPEGPDPGTGEGVSP